MVNDISNLQGGRLGIGALFLLGIACFIGTSIAEILTAALAMTAIVVLVQRRWTLREPPIILSLVWIGFVLLSATYAAAKDLPGNHFSALGKHLPIALGPIVAVAFAFWRLRRETVMIAFASGLAIGATVLLIRNGAISVITGEIAQPDPAFIGHINRNTAGLASGFLMISAATLLQSVVLQKPFGLVFTALSAAALGAAIIFAELLLISLQSRTALIATGIAMSVWFGAQLKYGFDRDTGGLRYRYVAAALLASLVIVSVANWSTITHRFMTAAVGIERPLDVLASGQDRLALTGLAVDLVQRRPLLGWGPDASRLPALFAKTSGVKSLTQFHNGYFQLLINFGVIGGLLMTALLAMALRAAIRSPGRMPAAPFSGAIALATYIAVSNITESVLFVKPAAVSTTVLIAIACMPAIARRLSQQS